MEIPQFTSNDIQNLFADKLIVVIGDSGKSGLLWWLLQDTPFDY